MIDRNRVDREVILAHVTGINRVLFTYPWLYDRGIHHYPSIRFSANIIEDNYKLRLSMRNITDRRTGRWDCKWLDFFFSKIIHHCWFVELGKFALLIKIKM